jgi:hypothetical protein
MPIGLGGAAEWLILINETNMLPQGWAPGWGFAEPVQGVRSVSR